MASDSSCLSPMMRREKPRLTKLREARARGQHTSSSRGSRRERAQCLLARDRVTADERVDVLDRLALDRVGAVKLDGALILLDARVLDLERLEVRLERGRQALVRLGLGDEKRVASRRRRVVEEQGGEARRLQL